ncbi:serine/threonine-protein phosphatase 6 regulatory ankyrin repeat subunit A-like isoform X4 [Branchiostoma floridae]|uniref:Serine/threonine-protein phosphatase 6 regulatory ankyrin repeat subunit A-like isoform X4 n=1 Tax=Branchiostoma floridae TaxID=7739 RepID=A0A9J7KKW5_BRAFL|nr:serine/threonine-protein phosphatase 6 regulatory ankyrin repeat subunit A-like isoform X4 [Branchiostoma floridae]
MAETFSDANGSLLYAAENGSVEGVKMALKAGAHIDFDHVYSQSVSSGTALYNASMLGHVDVVKLLLRKGASVAKRIKSSFTPLHAAAYEGLTEVVDLLVQHGATVDVRDGFQNTPLMAACGHNYVDTVRRLLELGARPYLTHGYLDERKTLKLCGRCKLTRYCSRDCQIQHWSVGHKKCCGHDVYSDDPAFKLYKSMAETMMACAHAK